MLNQLRQMDSTIIPTDYSHKAKTRKIGHTCGLCGKREHAQWNPETNERLIMNRLCIDCDLWIRTIAQDQINPIWYAKIMIGGMRYSARPYREGNCDKPTPIIVLENIKTGERKPFCDLKVIAVVPEFFKKEFPDNARIVTDDPEYPILDNDCNCN